MLFNAIKWDEIFLNLGINILSGIIVSAIFLFYFVNQLRPRFIISKHICRINEIREDLKGEKRYSFKIVNRSRYTAFDAKIELYLMKPSQHTESRHNLIMKEISIRTSNIDSIPKYRKKYQVKDPNALFAILIHTNEDMETALSEPNTYLMLKVTVRHGLSTLAKTITCKFDGNNICDNSKFGFASNVNTIPLSQTI